MITPSLEEVRAQLNVFPAVPVVCRVLWDYVTPVAVFDRLRRSHPACFLLESADHTGDGGRYSFLGVNPKLEIRVGDGAVTLVRDGRSRVTPTNNPLACLREILKPYRTPAAPGLPRFSGGLIGYFGYDTVRYVEPSLTNVGEDDLKMPDCHLFLYDQVLVFDHFSQELLVIQHLHAGGDLEASYRQAEENARALIAAASKPVPPIKQTPTGEMKITSNLTAQGYADMVRRAKEYILDGDIFQIVLSQRFEIENPPDSFAVYRRLRASNPSPYLYYFQTPDYCIVGASPEKLVSVENGLAATRPIAGTRPRGKTPQQDLALERELLADPKERSEHTMLVDLGRNDIGKVSRFGTVQVNRFMKVERYSQVMHLVSDVSGQLREDLDSLDALLSVLPAGTLSGAPKVRAMELIDQFERYKRGVYGGTIGYLSFSGSLDTCICIRTALYRGGRAYVQAGAGIVADSNPEEEYLETCNKAKAVLRAMEQAAAGEEMPI